MSVQPPRDARIALIFFFMLAGITMGSWVARIPDVQHRLDLSDGQLGLALLGTAVGALVALPTSGVLVSKFGSVGVLTIAGFGVCAMLPILPMAPSLITFALILFVFGVFYGSFEVPANSQAVIIEKAYQRPIMSSFHAMFSVGGLIGAATSGLIAGRGVAPVPHLAAVGVLMAIGTVIARPHLMPDPPQPRGNGPLFALPTGALLGLGTIGFCVLLGEGAMADWTAVYLRNNLGTTAAIAAAGYTAFSLMMAIGRFAGDGLTQRFSAVTMIRTGGLLVALGLGIGLFVGNVAGAVIGFAAVGAGLATLFPLVLSAAGRTPGVSPTFALTAVATAGYVGFLAGPPVIGFVAERFGLKTGLLVVAALGLVVFAMAGQARQSDGLGEPTPDGAGVVPEG